MEKSINNPSLDISTLKEIFKTSSSEQCIDVIRKLKGIELTPDIIELLIENFAHNSWYVRQEISHLLGESSENAVEHLKKSARSKNEHVCFWSLKTLTYWPEKAIPVFREILKTGNNEMRFYCVTVLRHIRTRSSVELLIHSFMDEDRHVRERAFESLVSMGNIVVPFIGQAFKYDNPDMKYWSMKLLVRLAGSNALPVIKKMLRSEDYTVKYFTISILGELKDPETIPDLIDALESDRWIIRKQARQALILFGEPVIPYLVKRFENAGPDLKDSIVKLISSILGPKSIHYFRRMILESPKEDMRFYAVSALGEIRNEESILLLMEALKDSSWAIRREAADQLLSMRDIILPYIRKGLESENPEIYYWSIRILAWMGQSATEDIIALLKKCKKRDRIFVISLLTPDLDSRLIGPLIDLLDDEHWPVRAAAANLLERVGERAIEELKKRHTDGNENIRFWTGKILASLGIVIEKTLPKETKQQEKKSAQSSTTRDKQKAEDNPELVKQHTEKLKKAYETAEAFKDPGLFKSVLEETLSCFPETSYKLLLPYLASPFKGVSLLTAMSLRNRRSFFKNVQKI